MDDRGVCNVAEMINLCSREFNKTKINSQVHVLLATSMYTGRVNTGIITASV